jgi:hypothetical protein
MEVVVAVETVAAVAAETAEVVAETAEVEEMVAAVRLAEPSQSFSQRCRAHRWWLARRWISRPKSKAATERV